MKIVENKKNRNISISLSYDNYKLIERLLEKEKTNKSNIIAKAINLYAKNKLEQELMQAYIDDNNDNKDFVNKWIYLFNEIWWR